MNVWLGSNIDLGSGRVLFGFECNICRSNKLILRLLLREILKRKNVTVEDAYRNAELYLKVAGQDFSVKISEEETVVGIIAEVPEHRVEEGALQQRNSGETVEDDFDIVTRKVFSEKEPYEEQERGDKSPESASEIYSSFQEVLCEPHATTRLLDGVVLVTCQSNGVRLKVRLCTMDDFDKISCKLLSVGAVSKPLLF